MTEVSSEGGTEGIREWGPSLSSHSGSDPLKKILENLHSTISRLDETILKNEGRRRSGKTEHHWKRNLDELGFMNGIVKGVIPSTAPDADDAPRPD